MAGQFVRRRFAHRIETEVARRLPCGPDGVIRGAEAISLTSGNGAVLVLHGFGDTPQSVRPLAEHLHLRGYAVRVPLLPGHGRSLRDFAASGAGEWLKCARDEYEALRRSQGHVAIVGQSMGGALALLLAVEFGDVPALVLLAPYLTMLPTVERVARRHRLAELVAPYLYARSEASILDPAERDRSLGYGWVPPRALSELLAIPRAAWDAAPRTRSPTLVLQSQSDNRIDAAAAARAFQRVGAAEKELHWLTGRGHVIAVDRGREEVFGLAEHWLQRHGAV